jgi:hypothetical protein
MSHNTISTVPVRKGDSLNLIATQGIDLTIDGVRIQVPDGSNILLIVSNGGQDINDANLVC